MIDAAQAVPMTSGEQRKEAGFVFTPVARGGRSLGDYDDDALMVRAQDGDKEAFEVLVGRHTDMVLAVSCRFLADPDAGRDVAQEVFLDLWLGRHRYSPAGKFRGYLATLTLNRCRDATRRRGAEQRRRNGLAAEGLPQGVDPAQAVSSQQSAQKLQGVLAELTAEDREILVMRYALEMQYDEIAEALGRPAGTLRSRVFHALRKMRAMLEEASS